MPTNDKPKLTPKEAKFVRAKAEGKSNREAGLIAGAPTPEAADKLAQRLSNNVQIQQSVAELMEAKGLGDDKLLADLAEGLSANKPNEFTGEVLPDFANRHKYLKTALELKGYLNKGNTLNVKGNVNIIPILGGASAVPSDNSDQQVIEAE